MLYTHLQILWRSILELLCISRRHYPVFREFMRDCPQAHVELQDHMEYGLPSGGLFLVHHISGFFFILPVPPIGAASGSYRQTYLYARLPTPIRIFDNLMALALGAPGQDGTDKLTCQAIVNVLADADDLAAVALNLLKNHGRMHKVTGEAAQVKDNNHIGQAVAAKLVGARHIFSQAIKETAGR